MKTELQQTKLLCITGGDVPTLSTNHEAQVDRLCEENLVLDRGSCDVTAFGNPQPLLNPKPQNVFSEVPV